MPRNIISDSSTSHPSPTEEGSQNLDRLAIPLLIAFSLALYIATTGYDLLGDDLILIGGNPYVKNYSVVGTALVAARRATIPRPRDPYDAPAQHDFSTPSEAFRKSRRRSRSERWREMLNWTALGLALPYTGTASRPPTQECLAVK
jgi:hypothetical protein